MSAASSVGYATMSDRNVELVCEAMSQSGCGILIADADARIVYVNKRLCEITGYEACDLIDENPKVLQCGTTPRETYLALWKTVSSGSPWHGELRNRRKTGEEWLENITISPIRDHRGAISHYCGIVSDITAERREQSIATALERSAADSEKAESMAILTVGLAHDLNNFFTAITAAASFARRAISDTQTVGTMLDQIESATDRGLRFVRQMTQLWKPSIPPLTELSLGSLLEEEARSYHPTDVGKRNVYFSPGTHPVVIKGNSEVIRAALHELIDNARDAAPDGPISVTVSSQEALQTDPEEFFFSGGLSTLAVGYIEVRDCGCGMDGYVVRRAFNPFFSLKAGHRGLGLAKVRGIMTSHRGAIGIVSSPGTGTAVRLYFPLSGVQSTEKTPTA